MFRLLLVLAFAGLLCAPARSFAAPPPVEDYGKLPAMQFVTLSPSGDRYAFVAEADGARRLYVATTANKALQIVNIGTVKVEELDWAGDDFVVIHTSATVDVGMGYTVEKQELSSAVVINVDTGKLINVFADHQYQVDHVVRGYYGSARIKDRWYGYFSTFSLESVGGQDLRHSNTEAVGDRNLIVPDLYRVDLETGDIALAAMGEPGARWLVNPQGDIPVHAVFNQQSGDWRIQTGARQGRILASGRDRLSGVQLLGFGQTADTVVIRRQDVDRTVNEELPLAGGPAKPVLDDQPEAHLIHDRTTKLWIGTSTEGDAPASTLFQPLFDARMRGAVKAFPGYRVHLTSGSADFKRMIVFTDGGDDSGTYWFVDIDQKSAIPLGSAYPSVTPADVGPVNMVDWKAADGLALRGVLTLPPARAAKNLPLVVMPHGGPGARDYPGFDYWAQAFAARGYAVFQPNFRGSTGYGKALLNAGHGEWGRKMQTDISDGAAELARQGIVDPKRECIVGGSYGGYAALAGVTVQQGLYRCAVSMAGVSDLTKLLDYLRDEVGDDSAPMRNEEILLGATSSWSGLHDISPAKLAAQADAPILLIHGKDDTVVPIDQSDEMEHALKAAGKPVERLTLDGADHWLLREDTRVAMLKASVAFVEKYNPPDPPPVAATTTAANAK